MNRLSKIDPQIIAFFAWEDGVRPVEDFDTNAQMALSPEDLKKIAILVGKEAQIEIDENGEPIDTDELDDEISNFGSFVSEVSAALWQIHEKSEDIFVEDDDYWDDNDQDNWQEEQDTMYGELWEDEI